MSYAILPRKTSAARAISTAIKVLSVGALLCASQVHATSFVTRTWFANYYDGRQPVSKPVVVAPQGNNQPYHLWGTTTSSGQIFDYYGTGNLSYQSSPATFPQGLVPNSPLLQVPMPNGEILFYGTATDAQGGNGVIYKYSSLSPATISIVWHFSGTCTAPSGGALALVKYGKIGRQTPPKIVGTTASGRTTCFGGAETIYEIDVAGNFRTLHTFTGQFGGDGAWPNGLVSLDNGAGATVYGSLAYGGSHGVGYVFAFNAATGQLSTACNFTEVYTRNAYPNSDLTYAFDPYSQSMRLFGVSSGGIYSGAGAIYSCDMQGESANAHHYFADYNTAPRDHTYYSRTVLGAPVVANGKLYGTAVVDDGPEQGVIYSYNLMTGQYQREHVFAGGTQGSGAPGGLTLLGNGLYGVTPDGGYGDGTLFKFQY